MAVVIGSLLRVSTHLIKKEFRFYLAKGYYIIASIPVDDPQDNMQLLFYILLKIYNHGKV
jgi:hypothetical protein